MRRKHIVRLISALTLLVFMLSMLTVFASADVFESSMPKAPKTDNVKGVYVYNIENDRVVFEYNSEVNIYPASLTKIMSFIVVSKKLSARLDEKITIESDMLKGTIGSHIGLAAGEVFTIRELMYIAFSGCYNDAVNALAYISYGSVSAFVDEMNAEAKRIGMEKTSFVNPTGIHNSSMYSTLGDIALMCREAAKDPLIMQVTSSEKFEVPKSDTTPHYSVYTKNMLISTRKTAEYYNRYASGLNAGATDEAGECVATVAKRDGLSYVIIVTGGAEISADGGKGYISSYRLANELIGWSLDNFGYVSLFDSSIPVADISVEFSKDSDKISLVPTDEIVMYLPLSFNPKDRLDFSLKLDSVSFFAPVEKGAKVGSMTVMYNDELLGEVSLVTTEGARLDEFLFGLERIKDFSQSRIFLLTVFFLVLYSLLLGIISLFMRFGGRKKEKRRK